MIKKLLLSGLILFIVYILLIFKAPEIAWTIEKLILIDWFNEFALSFKSIFDETVTQIPSSEEFLSWTIDIKNTVIDWVNTTKDKIDSFRETMSWAQDTYNDLKNTYDEAKDFINSNSWKIEDIKEVIETISNITETLTNTWETN